MGASITVMLATIGGFPISTTHGLTGALVGAGLVAIGTQVNFTALQNTFLLPLLLSPILAILLGTFTYALFRLIRISLGIQKEWCICVGSTQQFIPVTQPNSTNLLQSVIVPDVALDTPEKCKQRYIGNFIGINNQQIVNVSHFISAGIVSFARGLNDTPKIVALLLISETLLSIQGGMLAVGLAIAAGGLLNAKKVAETMSKKISAMNYGQGLAANLATGILVIAASKYGLPVSTTHVSVGSIFGIGLLSKQANVRVFYQILLSWILTLPIAAIVSAIAYFIFHR